MSVGKHAGQRTKSGLAQAVARAKGLSMLLEGRGISDERFCTPDESLDYQLFRATSANDALQLASEMPQDRAIAHAFKDARLNPENPWHWKLLLEIFAEAYYPAKDVNSFWSSTRLIQLLDKEFRLKQIEQLSRKSVNDQLEKFVKDRFGKTLSKVTLRTLLRQARDPSHNIFIRRAQRQLEDELDYFMKKHSARITSGSSRPGEQSNEKSIKEAEIARALMIYRTELSLTKRAIKALPPSVDRP